MILHLFTLLFVGLKLTAVIDWSWWLVFAPSLLQAVLVVVVVIVAAVVSR